MSIEFEVIKHLNDEVKGLKLHSSINQFINNFLKYLKEPRYQNPLTIEELSNLFQRFYTDLNSLIVHTYTQSNSTKKSLISNCEYFRQHPLNFDYLLAISNYSSSSIKLVKRTDVEALIQLRIFNFYKLLVILRSMELSLLKVFESVNDDDSMLFHKIFRFNERDLLIQELFNRKVEVLKNLQIPFKSFLGDNVQKQDMLNEFIESDPELDKLISDFNLINKSMLPSVKLQVIVKLQRDLVSKLSGFLHTNEINNDILLPILIYLMIYKVDGNLELFLNFDFVKNFTNVLNPYEIYLSNNASYNPPQENRLKIKKTTLFECLNLTDANDEFIDTNEFFKTNKELVEYANSHYFNHSENNFFLTNFEAVIFYLQSVSINELMETDTDEELLTTPIFSIVEKQLYKFPSEDELLHPSTNRSRSGSLLNTLTTRISEATRNRSRSNSNAKTRESFPMVDTESLTTPASPLYPDGPDNLTMMKNIINRFGSVSVSQLKSFDEDEESGLQSTKHNRATSLVESSSSPNNILRSRSPTFENSLTSQISPNKRNSIASKLSSGVSEIMTKFNTPATYGTTSNPTPNPTHIHNDSTASLRSLDDNDASTIISKRPDYSRSRTSSMQVMEKWFNNLSQPQPKPNPPPPLKQDVSDSVSDSHEGSVFSAPSKELTKYQNVDFDELTISDLRMLKTYYDQLCNDFGMKFESKSTDLRSEPSI